MRLTPLLLLVGSTAWAHQHLISIQQISHSIATLQSVGVVGVENLCYETDEFHPLIPKCVDLSSRQQHELRGTRPSQHGLDENNDNISTEYIVSRPRRERKLEQEDDENRDLEFYMINIGGTIISIFCVAVIAGMFLGFLTLDALDLRIKMQAAIDPTEREAAAAIFPLVNQNHRLLVTLLLMNAVAYECLPLFLDRLMPTYLTIVFSVTVLLIFGEIIPSAIFTGPDQLLLASKLAPLVKFSMTALHPFSKPLVMLMDSLVPEDDSEDEEEYNRAELSALVRIQYEERMEAQRKRDLAAAITENEGLPPPNKMNRRRGSTMKVPHMANQLNAEKQRRGHEGYQSTSTRRWRQLKEEIMTAAEDLRASQSDNTPDGGKHHTRSSSGGFQQLLQHIPSFSSISSAHEPAEPAFEQIAPPLEMTEVQVVEGALNLKTMCALDVYTPLRMLYAVPEDMLLTKEAFAEIYGKGYSRVPVYEPQPPPNENRITAMKGFLMTRQLIMIDWEDLRTVSTLPLYIPPCVSPRMNLVTLLHLLREGGSLMAFVCAGPHIAERALNAGKAIPVEAGFMGVVTLQDVLESVIQQRIYDEEDIAERNLASAILTQWAASMIQKFITKRRKGLKRLNSLENGRQSDVACSTSYDTTNSDTPKNEKTPLLGS